MIANPNYSRQLDFGPKALVPSRLRHLAGSETNEMSNNSRDHLSGNPYPPGPYQPDCFDRQGGDKFVFKIAKGAVGESFQDSGFRGPVDKHNHFGPGAFLAQDPEQGDPTPLGQIQIQ
jgi:hypothetical protein